MLLVSILSQNLDSRDEKVPLEAMLSNAWWALARMASPKLRFRTRDQRIKRAVLTPTGSI
jgi:hypothetical protein